MKLLVIGSGGREHALVWRLLKSSRVTQVLVAPGNGGTATMDNVVNVNAQTPEELVALAKQENVALTVVGPEAPLAAGVVDAFEAAGLAIFGPTKAAAQLESSKDFAKRFMVRHKLPTAAYETFSDPAQAHAYIDAQGAPIVIKADGLAAGKGVVVAMTLQEAHDAIDSMLGDGSLGQAGARVVIEQFLTGEEASFIVMSDGKNILALASSQDHKRLLDADQGPNTGGMGAYSPAPVVSQVIHDRIMKEVIEPAIKGMAADGIPYRGFLYAGLMIGDGDDHTRSINVLEFNCRMGDPETQPIMMRLQSDLVDVVEMAIAGRLDEVNLKWDERSAIGVVMASAGYPGKVKTGDVITGIPAPSDDLVVFHAGTALKDGKILTTSGRVLCVTALGDSIEAARSRAYAAVDQIHFDGAQYRKDIAWRAIRK